MAYNLRPRKLIERRAITERELHIMHTVGELRESINERSREVKRIVNEVKALIGEQIAKKIKFRVRRSASLMLHISPTTFANVFLPSVDDDQLGVTWYNPVKRPGTARTTLKLRLDTSLCETIFGDRVLREHCTIDKSKKPYYGLIVFNPDNQVDLNYCVENSTLRIKFKFVLYRKNGNAHMLI